MERQPASLRTICTKDLCTDSNSTAGSRALDCKAIFIIIMALFIRTVAPVCIGVGQDHQQNSKAKNEPAQKPQINLQSLIVLLPNNTAWITRAAAVAWSLLHHPQQQQQQQALSFQCSSPRRFSSACWNSEPSYRKRSFKIRRTTRKSCARFSHFWCVVVVIVQFRRRYENLLLAIQCVALCVAC